LQDFHINFNKVSFNLKESIEKQFLNKKEIEKFYDSEMLF
jgi:hypothetical protein